MCVKVETLPRRATVCQMTPDEKFVLFNSDTTLISYSLETMTAVGTALLCGSPEIILFLRDSSEAFIVEKQVSFD